MVADPVVDVGQVPVARKCLEIMKTLHKPGTDPLMTEKSREMNRRWRSMSFSAGVGR
jgi:hypothetical protein